MLTCGISHVLIFKTQPYAMSFVYVPVPLDRVLFRLGWGIDFLLCHCLSLSVSVSLSLCLSVCVCLSVCLSLSVSLPPSLSLSLCLSLSLPLSLYVCLSLCVSVCLCLSVCLSVSVSLSPSLTLSVSLSVSLSPSLSLCLSVSVCVCLSFFLKGSDQPHGCEPSADPSGGTLVPKTAAPTQAQALLQDLLKTIADGVDISARATAKIDLDLHYCLQNASDEAKPHLIACVVCLMLCMTQRKSSWKREPH